METVSQLYYIKTRNSLAWLNTRKKGRNWRRI